MAPKKLISLLLFVGFFLFSAKSALAICTIYQTACPDASKIASTDTNCSGTVITGNVCCCDVPASATNNTTGTNSISLTNPLGAGMDSPQKLIGKIINAALGIIGSLALLMFIFGGFVYLTSAGNEQKVSQGTKILIWSAIGMGVIFISYAAIRFLLSDVLGV